jgi:cbb3-type cytochrome oxidase maturation protein
VDIIYLLLPLSLALVAIIVAALLWAVKTRQFDDLEGPAHRILMDEPEIESQDTPESNHRIDDQIK